MGTNYPTIDTSQTLADIGREAHDLYQEGIISSAIFRQVSTDRIKLNALSSADRHVCLQIKLAAMVTIFVPADITTVFFDRQGEYVADVIDEYDTDTDDAIQFARLIGEKQYLDVISCLSHYAHVYGDIPNEGEEPSEVMRNSLASQTEDKPSRRYQLTGGAVYTTYPEGRRFFCEPNGRKMTISEPFDEGKWVRFLAQIAPMVTPVVDMAAEQIEDYTIRTPYWAREWLYHRTLVDLLSSRAASESGYFELESKARREAFQNRPGTGNVILPGDEMGGAYEDEIWNEYYPYYFFD